jgi:hypothetical protein
LATSHTINRRSHEMATSCSLPWRTPICRSADKIEGWRAVTRASMPVEGIYRWHFRPDNLKRTSISLRQSAPGIEQFRELRSAGNVIFHSVATDLRCFGIFDSRRCRRPAMIPSSQAIMMESFPPQERQTAMAMWVWA